MTAEMGRGGDDVIPSLLPGTTTSTYVTPKNWVKIFKMAK